MEKKDPIGGQLQALRKARKISVPKLSVILNIPRDRIYKWEQGTATPKYQDKQILQKWMKDENWKNVPATLMNEPEVEFNTKKSDKITAHDALLSVLVAEIAGLRASMTGEHAEVITKKIYKAAEDVQKLQID